VKSQEELLEILSEQVVEMEDEDIVETIQEYIENGYAVDQAVEALIRGMKEVGGLVCRRRILCDGCPDCCRCYE